MAGETIRGPSGVLPVPDPTLLTTQQLEWAIKSLREIITAERLGQRDVFIARFEGMDKAIELLQVVTDRQPVTVDHKVNNLKVLHEEKFSSIQTQFTERDVRMEQTSKDSKVAIDTALLAAKEAVSEQNKSSALAIAKSEAATTKQIDQQGVLITTTTKGLEDKIDDLKERILGIEGTGRGVSDNKNDSRQNSMMIIAVLTVVMLLIPFITRIINPPISDHTTASIPPGYVLVPAAPAITNGK